MSRVLVVGNDIYRSTIENYLRGSRHQVVSVASENDALAQPLKNIDFFVLGVRFPRRSNSPEDSRALVLAQRLNANDVPYDRMAVVGWEGHEYRFLNLADSRLGIKLLYMSSSSSYGNLSNLAEDITHADPSRKVLLDDINA